MSDQLANGAYELVAKVLSNNATRRERQEMARVDKAEFCRLSRVWDLTGRLQASPEHLARWQEAANEFKAQISSFTAGAQKKKSAPAALFTLKLAAIITFVFLAMFALRRALYSDVEIVIDKGERKSVELPDGTTIELNSDSKLVYPRNVSGDLSSVELRGEAFFRVRIGFGGLAVNTENARVTVLGTAFNIHARDGLTEVVVERGKVRLESLITSEKEMLAAGEMSIVDDGKPSKPQPIDLDKALAWRRHELVFDRMPLARVFAELERQFDIRIQAHPESYEDLTYTGSFSETQSAQDILRKISLAFGWKLTANDRVFIIEDNLP